MSNPRAFRKFSREGGRGACEEERRVVDAHGDEGDGAVLRLGAEVREARATPRSERVERVERAPA